MKSLLADWYQLRDESLRVFGDRWIGNANFTALYVPSAAIGREWNVLLNPDHPDFGRLKFQEPRPFELICECFADFFTGVKCSGGRRSLLLHGRRKKVQMDLRTPDLARNFLLSCEDRMIPKNVAERAVVE